MYTAEETLIKNKCAREIGSNVETLLVASSLLVDAMHEFADQFKHWTKLDGENNPSADVEVIAFVPGHGQVMAAYKEGCYWYSTKNGGRINPTYFHYQLSDPE